MMMRNLVVLVEQVVEGKHENEGWGRSLVSVNDAYALGYANMLKTQTFLARIIRYPPHPR